MTQLHSPTPGWVAARLGRYGHEMLLSLLAIGSLELTRRTTERCGPPANYDSLEAAMEAMRIHAIQDGEVHPTFAWLADSDDPGYDLEQMWERSYAEYPYLRAACEPLTAWMVSAPPARLAAIRDCAAELAAVDVYGLVANCPAGVLTEVHNQLVHVMQQRGEPVEYKTLSEQLLDSHIFVHMAAQPEVFRDGMSIGDIACAGGARLVGSMWALLSIGVDATTVHWCAADWDPLALALTACNLAGFGMPNVHTHLIADDHPVPDDWKVDLLLWNVGESMERYYGPAVVRAALAEQELIEDIEEVHGVLQVVAEHGYPEYEQWSRVSLPGVDATPKSKLGAAAIARSRRY